MLVLFCTSPFYYAVFSDKKTVVGVVATVTSAFLLQLNLLCIQVELFNMFKMYELHLVEIYAWEIYEIYFKYFEYI